MGRFVGNAGLTGQMLRAMRDVSARVRAEFEEGVPEAIQKQGYGSDSTDVTTEVDGRADGWYREALGMFGPIVSEDGTKEEQEAHPGQRRLTCDAVDGTRALVKGRFDQVGTALTAVEDEEVIAAFTGAIQDGTIIGFGPGIPVTEYSSTGTVVLRPDFVGVPLDKMSVLVRAGREYSPQMNRLLKPGSVFVGKEPRAGSLAVGFFDLWRGKAAAIALPASMFWTPWDNTPVFGISEKMGIKAFTVHEDGLRMCKMTLPLTTEPGKELLLVHRAFVPSLRTAVDNLK